MRFDLSAECLLTVTVRDVETGGRTMTEMVTLQSPANSEQNPLPKTKESRIRSLVRKMLRLKP
jgi:hypothetical protein